MDEESSAPQNIALAAAIFEASLTPIAAALGWLVGLNPVALVHLSLTGLGAGAVATVPLLLLLWACLKTPWQPLRRISHVLDHLLVPPFRHVGVAELAIISILAGLGEELLFRGVIQEATARWIGGPTGAWVGLLLGAALFALAHPITVAYGVLAGILGLYLGWLWLATGNLLVPVTAHALYDFVALVYFIKVREPGELGVGS